MEPRISIITLGVSDLERSVNFYRDGLHLPTNYKEGEGIAFFQLQGTWLALYPSDSLAEDALLPAERSRFGGFTLAHNVASKRKPTPLLPRPWLPGQPCSNPPPIPSGAATAATSPTPTDTPGKWPGTHTLASNNTNSSKTPYHP